MFFSSHSKTLNSYSGGIFVGFNAGFLITPHLTSNHDHEPCANWFEIRYIPRPGSFKTKSYLFITSNDRSPSAICLIACRRPREKNRGSGLDSASHGSSTTRFASLAQSLRTGLVIRGCIGRARQNYCVQRITYFYTNIEERP